MSCNTFSVSKQPDHYFSQKPDSDFVARQITVDFSGEKFRVTTAAGVFNPEGIDRGTAVLLRTLSAAPAGDVLDIGCGWGAITLHTALESADATVWAVDINERARMLTEANATALGLTNVRVCSPDEVPKDLLFDEIRSNPPIRIGKTGLHELLESWLPRLKPQGNAYLVVAKHLGAESLTRWLAERWPSYIVDRFARSKGFHIIRVQNISTPA